MHPHFTMDMIAWALAFLAGYAAHKLRAKAHAPYSALRLPVAYYGALAAGAVLGAFAFGAGNLILSGHEAKIGRSIVGALTGGIIVVEIFKKMRGLKGSTGGAFVAAFSVGTAIGRIGCYLSGLEDFTYGIETSLPWGKDFGDGIPRHPVQLYEAAIMAGFALCYFTGLAKQQKWAVRSGFYFMVLVYGAQRFGLEFLKPYAGLVGPFNLFHLVCAGLVIYALFMLRRHHGHH